MNARQAHFALLMGTTTTSATQAYIDSGYSPDGAAQSAGRLLTNAEVKAAIKRHRENVAAKSEWTKAEAIARLREISKEDKPDRVSAIGQASKMLPGWNEPTAVNLKLTDEELVEFLAAKLGIK